MQKRIAGRFCGRTTTSTQQFKCGKTEIYAYLQLIRMKEGKTNNTRNILRFAQRQHTNKPEELTVKELQDGLQFARIRKADLRKQAKGLRKVHLRNCLIDVMEKKQKSRAAAIKQ